MKKITILAALVMLIIFRAAAQFSSFTSLNPVSVEANTGEKPQSKVWLHDGKQWATLVTSSGVYIHRLDSTTWTRVLKLSSSEYGHADCKKVGDVTHILLFKGKSSDLFSVEYVPASKTYKLWSSRNSKVDLELDDGVETATIDIDTKGRMWLASDGTSDMNVRWSDSPYNVWSPPIVIGTGTTDDDISTVIAMPTAGKIGILWSNQNSQRFGFRTHTDGADPATWGNDEVPASQSALNVGLGFSDDHMNVKVSSNGTLYCAVKTSYDKPGYTKLALLIRRPAGTWDNIYKVSEDGTRGIVILNELADKITYIYTEVEDGGDILYRDSRLSTISFGSERTLISGKYNNASSAKQIYDYDIAILASNSNDAVGILGINNPPPPDPPVLVSPGNSSLNNPINPILTWAPSTGAIAYQIQVASNNSFNSIIFDQLGIKSTSIQVPNLINNSVYYWRVKANNVEGTSDWSSVRGFATQPIEPTLTSPLNASIGIESPINLNWQSSAYNYISDGIEVSLSPDFSSVFYSQNGITSRSVFIPNATHNTSYYWRVNTKTGRGTSLWSQTWNFKTNLAPPSLTAPANEAIGIPISPSLTWSPSSGAASYQVQLSTVPDFSSLVIDRSGHAATSFSTTGLTNNTTYFWRVRAFNPENSSNWSVVRSFTTLPPLPGIPALNLPLDAATSLSSPVNLTWNTASDATTYQVQVSTKADFSIFTTDLNNLQANAASISGLTNYTQYYWRVRGVNIAGTSDWSLVRTFRTNLASPVLVSPANSSTGQAIATSISWKPSANATSYLVQVSTMPDFSTLFLSQNNITATSLDLTGLTYSTAYYWRVQATDGTEFSDWSSTRSFTTMPPILAGHWKMDESTGTTLTDASEYLNHGAATGNPVKVKGISGLSLGLNGTDQYATIPNSASLNITKQITLATWIKPSRTGVTQVILKKALTDQNNGYELALTSSGIIFVRLNQDSNGDTYRLSSSITHPSDGNTWMHLAATYNGSTLKLYINGTEHKTKTYSSPPLIKTNTLPLAIGAQSNGSNRFQGALDDVRVYNIALSPAEILALATIPPTKPNLASPADLTTGVLVPATLSWHTAAGAPTYQVQVSTTADFSSTVHNQSSINDTLVQLPGLLRNTLYFWRVKASNVTGTSSWSAARSFTTSLETPVAVSPANAFKDLEIAPTLSWNASSGAETYQLQVSAAADFTTTVFDQNTAFTSLKVTGLANNVTYFWRVKASSAANISNWSQPWSFTTIPAIPPKPVLSSPADQAAAITIPPTLSWNASTDAVSYQVQVSTSSLFLSKVFDQSNITATSVQATGLSHNTLYFWRVKATNVAGSSSWASVRSFTTSLATPVPLSPADSTKNLNTAPALTWNVSDGAATYQVQVATKADFTTTIFDQSNLTTTMIQLTGLGNNVIYYWRIKAADATNSSAWSPVWSFTTIPAIPPKPVLASPGDLSASVIVPPTLSWNPATDAASYMVQVSATPDFATKLFDQSGITSTSVQVPGLANNSQYFWRVKAINIAGNSNWSATWSFSTVPPNLAGLWKMDETTGTTLTDGSGFGNNGTAIGNPTKVKGIAGLALNLNGTSQYASIPNHATLNLTEAITVAAWIKPTRKDVTQVVMKKALTDQNNGYELALASTGKIFFRFNQDSNGDTYRLSSSVVHPSDGQTWMHVAATYNGSTLKLYINGVEHATKTFSTPTLIKTNTLPLAIGAQSNGSNRFQGAIDEARIYKVALTGAEIRELAAIMPSTPTLTSPGNLASGIGLPPALSWEPASGAPTYQVQVSATADFASPIFDRNNITITGVQISGLANTTRYFWRVKASNTFGSSTWSSVWSFTTGSAAPTLVGHWKMDESGGTTLTDDSSFGNNGTTTGSPGKVTGVSGLALNLNGTSQYATIPNAVSLNPNTAITMAAWIKPTKTGTAQVILKKGITGQSDGYELALTSTGKIFFRINQDSNGDTYRLNSTVTHPINGTWMHIAATYDGTNMKLYINGKEEKAKAFSPGPALKTNSTALAIGAQSNGTNRFQGAIDEARIYNVALSAAEIQTLANASAPVPTARLQQPAVQEEFKVYPNPFSSKAKIRFSLPETTEYSLNLYDFNGSKIQTLQQGLAKAGEIYTIETNGQYLRKGLYMVKLQTRKEVKTLTLMLEK